MKKFAFCASLLLSCSAIAIDDFKRQLALDFEYPAVIEELCSYKTPSGNSLLHEAARDGDIELLEKFLQIGCLNVNESNDLGNHPIDLALNLQIRQLIAQHGGQPKPYIPGAARGNCRY